MRAMALDGDTAFTGDHLAAGPWVEFQARSVQITDPDPGQVLFGDVDVIATAAVTTNLTGVQSSSTATSCSPTRPPLRGCPDRHLHRRRPHTLAARAQYSSGSARNERDHRHHRQQRAHTQQRLQVDLATDAIDLDEFTEVMVKGLLNRTPSRPLPVRSRASVDPTAGVLSYLATAGEHHPPQDEIESFVTGSVEVDDPDPACTSDTRN